MSAPAAVVAAPDRPAGLEAAPASLLRHSVLLTARSANARWRPPAVAGTAMTVPAGAGPPSDINTWPETRTRRVAINPKLTLVFSCATPSVMRVASDGFGVPGKYVDAYPDSSPIGSVTSGPAPRSIALT